MDECTLYTAENSDSRKVFRNNIVYTVKAALEALEPGKEHYIQFTIDCKRIVDAKMRDHV